MRPRTSISIAGGLAISLSAVLATASTTPQSPQTTEGTVPMSTDGFPLNLPNCNIIAADQSLYVPPTFSGPVMLASQTGGYGYRPNCGYFLADVKLSSGSNTVLGSGIYPLKFSAGAYDLPSSATNGGTTPIDQEDCERYSSSVQIWYRPSETSGFGLLCGYSEGGAWSSSSSSCTIQRTSTSGTCPTQLVAPPPGSSDLRTYRFAVRTMARTSTQEASVTISSPLTPTR